MARSEGTVEVQHKDNESIIYAPTNAASAGEALFVDGIGAVVAAEATAASANGAFYTRGTFQFPIASGVTISQGQKVAWDVSENKAVLCNSSDLTVGDFFLGTATKDGTAAGGYVEVDINVDAGVQDKAIKTITATTATAVAGEDSLIVLDATSNAVTLTLPDAATAAKLGQQIAVVCSNADNTVTISKAGSDTVMGAASITLDVRESVILIPIGTDWIALANSYNVATAGLGADAVTNAKIADDAVSLEHLDSGIAMSYINVGYATVASDAGTGGTVACAGCLTSDHVQATLTSGWTNNTGASAHITSAYVSGAGTITYAIGGTSVGGTAGGIVFDVFRAAS